MKFGINTFLFTSPFTNESIDLFPRFKKWGFDSVEIAIEDPSHINPQLVKQSLDDNGITCVSICAVMAPGRDLRGTDNEQNAAIEYIKSVLDIMPELGCPILVGPLYSSVGRAEIVGKEEYKIQWDTVVRHLRELSQYARKLNVNLAIEPLNRYETDFINTADQAMKMVKDVNCDELKVHLDTFHMNIEEKNPAKAILNTGDKLGHFHACGCDRGTPGSDHINWEKISSSLKKIEYNGNTVIESFTQDVKAIAKAASIWRQIESSKEKIAVEGLEYLKSNLII